MKKRNTNFFFLVKENFIMYYYFNDNLNKSNYLYKWNYYYTTKINYFKIKSFIRIIIFFNKVLFLCLPYSFSNLLNKIKKITMKKKRSQKLRKIFLFMQ